MTLLDASTDSLSLTLTPQLRVGVVGCGYWGPKLARNFHELTGAALNAICDFRDDRLAHMQSLYPEAAVTRQYRDLLESELDAIAIATPVNTHYRLARAALEAGKHVLVEKPLTASAAQAAELVEIAAARGLTLMVGHTFEYNPAVEAVRGLVASGDLGEICYMDSVRVNLGLFQPDINVIWDLAPHDISILNYVLGLLPVAVSARAGAYVRLNSALHEVAYITLTYPNCVMANLRLSWLDPIKVRQLIVVGTAKMLVYDDIAADKVVVYDKGTELPPYSDTEQEFHMSYRDNGRVPVPIEWVEPLRNECQHFLDCICTGATPRSSGQDGLNVVKVLEACQKSLLNGGMSVPVGL